MTWLLTEITRRMFGAVLWCDDCQRRTAHVRTRGGAWVCGRCGEVSE